MHRLLVCIGCAVKYSLQTRSAPYMLAAGLQHEGTLALQHEHVLASPGPWL